MGKCAVQRHWLLPRFPHRLYYLVMNRIYNILIGLVACIAAGQAQTPVTLAESRVSALEYNRSLDLARMDVQYAEAAVKSARTAYLPKVDGSGSFMYLPDFGGVALPGFFLPTAESAEAAAAGNYSGTSDAYFPGYNLGMDDLKIYMAEVSLQQPVFAGGRLRTGNQMADRGAEIAREALSLTRAEVVHGTDRAFWGLVAIQEQVVVLQKYVEALDSLESQLAVHFELGLLPRSELLKVTVQRNEARLQLLEVKNMQKIAGMNLARLTGRPLDEPLTAVYDAPAESLSQFEIKNDFSARPELRILQQKSELARLEKLSVRGEYLPQIGVSAGYRYIDVPNLVSGSWNLTVGAGVSIPIIHWRDKKHRTDMARINQMKSEVNFKDAHEQISLEVQQNRFNLETAIQKVDVAAVNLEQAEETLSEVEISFNAGLNNITDLLNARVAWQRASAAQVEARANLEIVKSAYMKSVGLL